MQSISISIMRRGAQNKTIIQYIKICHCPQEKKREKLKKTGLSELTEKNYQFMDKIHLNLPGKLCKNTL